MIIDFHTHIFPKRIRDDRAECLKADSCFAALYWHKDAKLASAEDLIENMDKAGVDKSVVLNIGWQTHELCVETNDYIMESVSRYPDRLVGFCSVAPGDTSMAERELERCVGGGVRGVGELRPDTVFLAESSRPLQDCIVENGLVLLVHASEPVGHIYDGKGSITPEVLYPFIQDNPEMKIVLAHWGGGMPFYALMPEVKKALGNVYYDAAATPYLYNSRIYSQVAQLVGADKILFGTDYPLLTPQRLLGDLRSQGLPPDTLEMVLSGNALRLLGI